MKYELIENGERVLFDNGENYCVHTDEDGRKYFSIPNMKDPEPFKSFHGKIKDAIEAIRDGYGDVLSVGGVFGGKSEDVYRFVDREYGEQLRQQTIKGWEDTVFGYTLVAGYTTCMSGLSQVKEGGEMYFKLEDIWFDSEEEAQATIQEWQALADKAWDEFTKVYPNLESLKADSDWIKKSKAITKPILGEKNLVTSSLWSANLSTWEGDESNYVVQIHQAIKKTLSE